jgi:Zn finger protein HypA/HybF involved in hydrogenase expression
MRLRSVYELVCLCGRQFCLEQPEEIKCPDCGRRLVVCWNELHDGKDAEIDSVEITIPS